jgi:hypothetical protein
MMIYEKIDLVLAGCLRRLFKSRFILRSQATVWFQNIVEHRESIQNILNKFLLHLDINETLGVIQIRPSSEETEELLSYQMGRTKQLSPFASILLVYLRQERISYFMNPQSQSFPQADFQSLRQFVENFQVFKMDSQFERNFRRALEELEQLQVIIKTKNNETLYEISPLCELILPADEIAEYKARIENYFSSPQRALNLGRTDDPGELASSDRASRGSVE